MKHLRKPVRRPAGVRILDAEVVDESALMVWDLYSCGFFAFGDEETLDKVSFMMTHFRPAKSFDW